MKRSTDSQQSLTYIEIDLDYCANTYGTAPCTASIPETGTRKCFNTIKTCQDRENFVNAPVTLRFGKDEPFLPRNIDCLPYLNTVAYTPGVISLGENLGQRATLTITFRDGQHSDTGVGGDKYYAERDYNPVEQGTYWGKFRARQPYVRGRPLRLIRGLVGQALTDMEVRHYVLDSFTGPDTNGVFTLIAKDVLKLADDDRSQAPRTSTGRLVADITNSITSATLTPAGIGNAEYPSSGYVCIGGNEVCAFTRSSDVLTLTRGQFGTLGSAHHADDRVQICLLYTGVDPALVIQDLMQTYALIDSDFIPIDAWQSETATYLSRVITTIITEPTGVNTLISEIIQQTALVVWWKDIEQIIRLQVLRGIPTSAATYTAQHMIDGTFRIKEQPNKRVSHVQTFYGQRDPTKKIDDPSNYVSNVLTFDGQSASDYGSAVYKTIYSRWIPQFGRTIVERINDIIIARFKDPPRLFDWALHRYDATDPTTPLPAELGGGYRLMGQVLQDETGAPTDAPVQAVAFTPLDDRFNLSAEEVLFQLTPEDLDNRTISIDTNGFNVNLRTVHDSQYPEIVDPTGITLTVTVETGVTVGGNLIDYTSTAPSFDVGDWPPGLAIKLILNGSLKGRGGYGGIGNLVGGASPACLGLAGGTALYTRYPIDVEYGPDAEIWAGGGGGGGSSNLTSGAHSGGGGGAGTVIGPGGVSSGGGIDGQPGTETAGGLGGTTGFKGGNGGARGVAGTDGTRAGTSAQVTGGAAGNAIDGVSYVTVLTGTADIVGAEIN